MAKVRHVFRFSSHAMTRWFHQLPALVFAPLLAAAEVDFNREVQPILSENCYQCHGPDAKAREADLRLDKKEGAYRTADGITVVKPGDPAGSELITRIFSSDKDELMPPPKSNRKLTDAQRELLKRWVAEGAKWGEHWAFVAAKRPAVPGIDELRSLLTKQSRATVPESSISDWPRNPIDHFVLARLLREELAPSPAAAPEKLCRRLYLDLTGIPPAPAEVDQFLEAAKHDRKSAVENLVDRLLASARYGERMVWDWLDAARYADTNGYQGDPTRAMWYWRDWAIRAFNENKPFDQFTIEQLAGDLLPNPTQEQLIATGFHRNHMINGEGGRIAEESRVEYVQDRVETTGTVWMGLTFNCCRCHDHKFDPLTQREYYQLSAYFNSIDESGANDAGGLANPVISLASPEQQTKIEEKKSAENRAKQERDALEKKLRSEQAQWEQELRAGAVDGKFAEIKWTPLIPHELFSDHGTVLTKSEEGAVLASGPNPPKESIVFVANSKLGAITAFKLEVLPDPSLVNQGPGRADNGNFVLTEITLQGGGRPVDLAAVSADFIQNETHVPQTVFDGNPETGWAVMPQFGKPHTLIFEARGRVGSGGDVLLSFRLDCKSGHVSHNLGKFRLSATTDAAALLRPMPDNVRAILLKAADGRSTAEQEALTKYYLETNSQLAAATAARDAAKKAREATEKEAPRTMVMRERPKPRDTFILVKGAYDKFADKVAHGTPAILPPLPEGAPSNRLALAQWLVSSEHPLTARVTVNRLWQMFFQRGLVKTPEDFGVQGEKPTHPELLDWLASEFVNPSPELLRATGQSGRWNIKHLVKLIVTSATYQQESKVPSGMAERDPENALLARGPRTRLPSWMLRDQALAVSGLLVEKVGGPPVKVYQPAGVWEDATFGQIKFTQDHGEALYRRSLYIFWRRIVGPTLFFDVANRQNCMVKVGRTNTPLHALVTLNDVTYVEAARALAERMLKEGGRTDEERIGFAFRLCTARRPTDPEKQVLLASLNRLRTHYTQDPAAGKKLIATGESKPDGKLDPAELAAHTALGTLLLNLDETLTNE